MAEDTELLRWAEITEFDYTVNENNKSPVPPEVKTSGLKDQQPLPRQWLNSQFYNTWKIIEGLQEQINNLTLASDDYLILLETLFQVGDIWSTQSSDDPAVRFGFGTWEKIDSRFMVSSSSTDSDFIGAGTQGGNKFHSHSDNFSVASHTLTESQVPTYAHNHSYRDRYIAESSGEMGGVTFKETLPTGYNNNVGSGNTDNNNTIWAYYNATTASDSFGGGGSHTHGLNGGIASQKTLPPYEVFHVWRRIA